ncbi:MAG TPA: hypothetical protein VGJ04_01425 [Pirellulales bacterium]
MNSLRKYETERRVALMDGHRQLCYLSESAWRGKYRDSGEINSGNTG